MKNVAQKSVCSNNKHVAPSLPLREPVWCVRVFIYLFSFLFVAHVFDVHTMCCKDPAQQIDRAR